MFTFNSLWLFLSLSMPLVFYFFHIWIHFISICNDIFGHWLGKHTAAELIWWLRSLKKECKFKLFFCLEGKAGIIYLKLKFRLLKFLQTKELLKSIWQFTVASFINQATNILLIKWKKSSYRCVVFTSFDLKSWTKAIKSKIM